VRVFVCIREYVCVYVFAVHLCVCAYVSVCVRACLCVSAGPADVFLRVSVSVFVCEYVYLRERTCVYV